MNSNKPKSTIFRQTRSIFTVVILVFVFGVIFIRMNDPRIDVFPIYGDAQNITKSTFMEGPLERSIIVFQTEASSEEIIQYYRNALFWRNWRYRGSSENGLTIYFNKPQCPFYRVHINTHTKYPIYEVEIKHTMELCR